MTTIPETRKDTNTVRLEKVYPQSPERVWDALTTRRALERWLMPNDFKPQLGHRFSFRNAHRRIECEVVALEQGKRLDYTWREGDEPLSVVSWTLEPVANGTRVRLQHQAMTAMASGATNMWDRPLQTLEMVLDYLPLPITRRVSLSPISRRGQRQVQFR